MILTTEMTLYGEAGILRPIISADVSTTSYMRKFFSVSLALVLTFRIEPVLACSTLPTQLYKITKPLIALVGMTIQLVQVTLKITAPLFNR